MADEAILAGRPLAVALGRPASTWRLLAALVTIYAFGHLDRQILSLLVEPLKRDLSLTDSEIGLLQGFAFVLFMALAGLPIGRLVDKGRRGRILAGGILTWGAATVACAFASTFPALIALRMGVGAGEAVLTPSAHSLIAEAAPGKRLGLAMGLFGVGSYIGAGLAFVLGAFILVGAGHLGPVRLLGLGTFRIWQLVFLAVGVPALPMALWALTLREPPRPVRPHDGERRAPAPTAQFARMGLVNLTGGFVAAALNAEAAWFPTYLIRTFHWTAPAAGVAYGLIVMTCGAAGVVAGGLLGDLAVARGHASGRLMTMGAGAVCAAPFALAAPLMPGAWPSLALLIPAMFCMTISLGLLPAVQQAIAPPHRRGSASALGTLTVNLIALGLGPTGVALATDDLFHTPAAVGRSLALISPIVLLIAAACASAGLRPYALIKDRLP